MAGVLADHATRSLFDRIITLLRLRPLLNGPFTLGPTEHGALVLHRGERMIRIELRTPYRIDIEGPGHVHRAV